MSSAIDFNLNVASDPDPCCHWQLLRLSLPMHATPHSLAPY